METSQANSPRVAVAALLITLVIAPLLYVLSFGPVVGLAMRGHLPQEPVFWFYHPIKMLHDAAGPPVSTLLQMYLSIFD